MARIAGYPHSIFGGDYGADIDTSRWVVIYPPYIDSARKESEGRKIAKEKCVEKPNMEEVFECTKQLGLRTQLERDKAYCRDYWARGRIRVSLFDSEGRPVLSDIPNRRTLYARVAALIPKYREKKGGSSSSASGKSGAKGSAAPAKKSGRKKGKR